MHFPIYIIYLGLMVLMGLTHKSRYFIYTKTLCSIAFVTIACLTKGLGFLFGIALAFFALGDFLLVFKREKMKLGIIAFIIGNLVMIGIFSLYLKLTPYQFILPVVAMIILTILDEKEIVVLEQDRPYAFVYSFVLALAFSSTLVMAVTYNHPFFNVLALGYGLYFISDIFELAYVYVPASPKWIGAIVLTLYYIGMLFIALSVMFA
ncbi:MAG: lysoplasmalogenase family protein [Sharpea porci]|uniref:lysoplasmalogenase family protein n=1 Tax=Sharpea porci TaxID=2652286 RepID=UPI00240A7119|nr:lysoplasmalogenase family protein [Sharpea porci]MDD6711588.1 lysoplasmalogenase family protein [Sharpea porci]